MKVNITASLMAKMNVLSSEYNIEVGGYLTGKIKNGEIFLDDLLIPNQRISAASVDINTNSQVEMFRKYGARCKKIIGHFHSHHSMGCFWSAIDLNNMNNIMGYKDLFVFIVSSKGNHKVKVCMKNPLTLEFDDCDLYLRTVMIDQLRMKMKNLMNNDTTPDYSSSKFLVEDDINNAEIAEETEKELEEELKEEFEEELKDKSEAAYYG